ncbi:serine dehydratase beta chain [uncultured Granulicatella sp.]|uniref:serine dehydratase beta chain n=1 Tax=uncultured Granulicatella sp. TaxID=316089 RepID=UPI0028DC1C6F|nr:serine dehydratase beta chain [uncultured Granulicatella sp.]
MDKVFNYKSCFDIIGPIMIGPSSSHTAGALAIGRCARQLFGGTPTSVQCIYYESFAQTHKGHGTDFAIISGVLGFETDDERVPQAVEIATNEGISIEFIERDEPSPVAHANTADLTLMSATRRVRLIGTSIGGGTVEIKYVEVDGFISNLSGPLPIILEILPIEEDSTVEPLLEEYGVSIGKQKELKEGSSRFISYELNGLISPTLQEKLQFIQQEKTIYVFT